VGVISPPPFVGDEVLLYILVSPTPVNSIERGRISMVDLLVLTANLNEEVNCSIFPFSKGSLLTPKCQNLCHLSGAPL
jgi:hypothetical protein